MDKFPIITICCSTRYLPQIIDYYNKLTQEGNIVLADLTPHDKQNEFDKELVDKLHLAKIDMCDEVHILIYNHRMGYSVGKEHDYAKKIGKPIKFIYVVEEE